MALHEKLPQSRARLSQANARLERLGAPGLFAIVALPLLAIYLATATWTYPLINDTYTNSVTAWSVANKGTVFLEEFKGQEDIYGTISWIVPAGDSITSKYPPGASLLAVPLYRVWGGELGEHRYEPENIDERWIRNYPELLSDGITLKSVPIAPGTTTASVATAVAMGILAVVFQRLGGTTAEAMGAAYVIGLGTSAWPVASDQLWQHGPAMLWIAVALLISERYPLGSGLSYAAAILTRPPLAVIAAGSGLVASWKQRSVRPALEVGVGASVGLIAFLVYNAFVFGNPSVSAGYDDVFQQNVFSAFNVPRYLKTLLDALISQRVGLLVWSPFLLVLIPGLGRGWRAAPAWAQGSALGGVAYLLVQYKANSAAGGEFIGYRYPLEALIASAPVLFLAYRTTVAARLPLRRLLLVAVVLAIIVQGLGAVGIGVI